MEELRKNLITINKYMDHATKAGAFGINDVNAIIEAIGKVNSGIIELSTELEETKAKLEKASNTSSKK